MYSWGPVGHAQQTPSAIRFRIKSQVASCPTITWLYKTHSYVHIATNMESHCVHVFSMLLSMQSANSLRCLSEIFPCGRVPPVSLCNGSTTVKISFWRPLIVAFIDNAGIYCRSIYLWCGKNRRICVTWKQIWPAFWDPECLFNFVFAVTCRKTPNRIWITFVDVRPGFGLFAGNS